MAMNLVVLTGRLTRDPELKYTQSGKAFAKFSLAVGRAFNKDEVDFVNCTAWNKTAELAGEYLRKGNLVGIQGSLRVNTTEIDGQKRTFTEVNVDRLEFLDTKKSSEGGSGGSNYSSEPAYSNASENTSKSTSSDDDDEFPF